MLMGHAAHAVHASCPLPTSPVFARPVDDFDALVPTCRLHPTHSYALPLSVEKEALRSYPSRHHTVLQTTFSQVPLWPSCVLVWMPGCAGHLPWSLAQQPQRPCSVLIFASFSPAPCTALDSPPFNPLHLSSRASASNPFPPSHTSPVFPGQTQPAGSKTRQDTNE